MRTPRSQWHHLANQRIKREVEAFKAECPAFHMPETALGHTHPKGDWQDNIGGFEQALQDMAAGRAPWTTVPNPSFPI